MSSSLKISNSRGTQAANPPLFLTANEHASIDLPQKTYETDVEARAVKTSQEMILAPNKPSRLLVSRPSLQDSVWHQYYQNPCTCGRTHFQQQTTVNGVLADSPCYSNGREDLQPDCSMSMSTKLCYKTTCPATITFCIGSCDECGYALGRFRECGTETECRENLEKGTITQPCTKHKKCTCPKTKNSEVMAIQEMRNQEVQCRHKTAQADHNPQTSETRLVTAALLEGVVSGPDFYKPCHQDPLCPGCGGETGNSITITDIGVNTEPKKRGCFRRRR